MVSGLFDNHPETFVPVYYHLNGDAVQPWCDTRNTFYGFAGSPHLWLDGVVDGGFSYEDWPADLVAEEGVSTDVTIEIEVERVGANLDILANICVEAGGAGKDMRIYIVQVLDHYPSAETFYRNAFRQVVTEDVTVASGACVDVQKSRSLKAIDMAQLQDIGVVVWAQEPLNSGPAEIFQAAYVFPFIMTDGFESGDLTAWE